MERRDIAGQPKERLLFLDGLRGSLALLVALGHLNFFVGLWTTDSLLALKVRVPAFFALSGFVLYLSSAGRDELEYKNDFLGFARHRALRLLPPYYVAILAAFVLPYLLWLTGLAREAIIPDRHWDSLRLAPVSDPVLEPGRGYTKGYYRAHLDARLRVAVIPPGPAASPNHAAHRLARYPGGLRCCWEPRLASPCSVGSFIPR